MTARYLILGNGIAGQTCAETLRARDSACSINILAAERHPLYNRVALPRFLAGELREDKVVLRSVADYEKSNIKIHFSTRATRIDPRTQIVHTDSGQSFPFDALLIATGGRPKPPIWPEVDRVFSFQTLDDAKAIIESTDRARNVLVIGGGFIAYELAEAINRRRRAKVTWMIRGPSFLRAVLDPEAWDICRRLGEGAGVDIVTEDRLERVMRRNGGYLGETKKGLRIEFDVLAYGIGLDYNLEPLAGSGIAVRGGVITDARLRSNITNIFAAGDVALFYDRVLGRHNQMGTWDNAQAHGKVAAYNMAGDETDLVDVPTYTTTLFGSTLAVIGAASLEDPPLDSVCSYSAEQRQFRKLLFRGERLVGAVIIGSPKGRKKLIEMIRSCQPVARRREDLLDPSLL
jgi:NAD(P)H-nitrite reductase large subunit